MKVYRRLDPGSRVTSGLHAVNLTGPDHPPLILKNLISKSTADGQIHRLVKVYCCGQAPWAITLNYALGIFLCSQLDIVYFNFTFSTHKEGIMLFIF